MTIRTLSFAVALAALGAACSEDVKEQSPGEVLARDSSLSSGLKQADTSAFADGADAATTFNPDSAMSAPARPARPDARARMRPVPATIHPEPIPTRRLPTSRDCRSRATTILEAVPGAALPPAASNTPCASPAAVNQ